MNIWKILLLTSLVFAFSGCSNRTQSLQLRNINAQQAYTIRQQQILINAYRSKYGENINNTSTTPVIQAPKKVTVLKTVEDTNYSSKYMYPKAKEKVSEIKQIRTVTKKLDANPNQAMTKEECVGMIGEAKFSKYTQMFGSEASSLKRCAILKRMKK